MAQASVQMARPAPTKLIDYDLCYSNRLYTTRIATMTEPWVSVDQIAEHLGVTRDSIYRWIERKGLPAHRVGRLWKFKISEVDEWVRAGGADEESKKRSGDR